MRAIMVLAALAGVAVVALFDPVTEAKILVTAMTVLAWIFCLLYGLRSNWRATQGGRGYMYTSAALALLGTQLLTVWWLGDYPYRSEIRSMVLVVLVMTLLYRTLVLEAIQRRERRE